MQDPTKEATLTSLMDMIVQAEDKMVREMLRASHDELAMQTPQHPTPAEAHNFELPEALQRVLEKEDSR